MKAKLIKDHDDYHLVNDTNFIIGTTDEGMLGCTDKMKLSLKNCQAIERGYDLDELANNEFPDETTAGWKDSFTPRERKGFKAGFQKALEILGDKKFSEFLDREKELGISDIKTIERIQWYYKTYFDKSQQTEWDVEIEMVPALSNNGNVYYGDIPKLDADRCLILKRMFPDSSN